MNYGFSERLNFSRGIREKTDIETLKVMIVGSASIEKTDEKTDRAGIDYIARLRSGAEVLIDAKARDKGASRFWKYGPEVALEIWSDKGRKVTGWTLNESKNTDLILFTFDPSDTLECWLVSFQLLRIAFRNNITKWYSEYKTAIQTSGYNGRSWKSECVFVPIAQVEFSINEASRGELVVPPRTKSSNLN
jgi:hypothetical protein